MRAAKLEERVERHEAGKMQNNNLEPAEPPPNDDDRDKISRFDPSSGDQSQKTLKHPVGDRRHQIEAAENRALAESGSRSEYDDARARKHLAKAIAAHHAKLGELAGRRSAIEQAEAKLARMKEAIDKMAHVEDAVAEAAADALRRGTDVSERSAAWKAKVQRDELIAEHKLLQTGFARLQARASGLECQVAAEHDELLRVREPIVQNVLENLAGELAMKESEAATLRSRLYGFSLCSNGPNLQKLPPAAAVLLRSAPKNATSPQTNSPAHHAMNREKEAFRSWKKALESDADARLRLY